MSNIKDNHMNSAKCIRSRSPSLAPVALLVLCPLIAATTTVSHAQQLERPAMSQSQMDVIAGKYSSGHSDEQDLHLAQKMKDGARGYDTWISPELPTANFSPYDSQRDKQLHSQYCKHDAIVTAKAVSSTSHLVRNKSSIITTTNFQIHEVIKPADGLASGDEISVVRQGGEVSDQGETLRVRVAGRTSYKSGAAYLLLLNKSNVARVYYAPNFITVGLKNGELSPSSTGITPFKVGEPLNNFKAQLTRITSKFPCN
jgi:hypothetical protein